ncbi:MAG: polyprenyl synthetase family protein [Clostridia bacterium]|nr:polyprenyl synthetase family protein [Clostridia bacterium]MBQ3554320.1 polyprenyl synthetase family protein [Clostridia bacterium]
MRYSLLSGGKRIRPVMVLACEELFSNEENSLPFACALEMIHTYSLIHDDLPCMDNDDLRRGKPTNHIVYGEAMAVLAGDALLTNAFSVALKHSKLAPKQTLNAALTLSNAAGTEGMIGGQVIDMASEGRRIDEKTLRTMHLCKTGALIIAAVRLGAIAGGASLDDISRLEDFAHNLGIAFQIKDDILDVEGNEALLGKKTGMDKENQKTTFVTLYGLEKSKELLNEYTEKAKEALTFYGDKAEFLIKLSDYLLKREV